MYPLEYLKQVLWFSPFLNDMTWHVHTQKASLFPSAKSNYKETRELGKKTLNAKYILVC